MKPVLDRWKCQTCAQTYPLPSEAIDCCPPEVELVFGCDKCGEFYYEEYEAAECCVVLDANGGGE